MDNTGTAVEKYDYDPYGKIVYMAFVVVNILSDIFGYWTAAGVVESYREEGKINYSAGRILNRPNSAVMIAPFFSSLTMGTNNFDTIISLYGGRNVDEPDNSIVGLFVEDSQFAKVFIQGDEYSAFLSGKV